MYAIDNLLILREAYQLTGPRGMSLEVMEEDLATYSEQHAVPLKWVRDQVDNGADAKIPVQDCIVAFHPDHEDDYYKVVFDFEAPTKLACLRAYVAGKSVNSVSVVAANALIQGGKMALANVQVAENETGDSEECMAEKEYYASLYNVVNALIGASQV